MKTTLIIAALMLAATVGHAAEVDYVPRIGETTAEYNARVSGDVVKLRKIQAINRQKAEDAAEEAAAIQRRIDWQKKIDALEAAMCQQRKSITVTNIRSGSYRSTIRSTSTYTPAGC